MKCKYNNVITFMKLYIKKLRSDKSILKLNEIIHCIIHRLSLSNKDLYENIYLKLLSLFESFINNFFSNITLLFMYLFNSFYNCSYC